jgi:lysosomal alpha-mannosidase
MFRASGFTALVALYLLCCVVASLVSADPIEICVLSHTHDDAGWLKTVDQYHTDNVQFIISSVVDTLIANPDRKFVYVEQAFFTRWWADQSSHKKDQVRQLVKNAQLEFVLGGYVMNDEASPSLNAIVEQMTEGHEFLLEELGVVPRTAHHVDPFGQSSAIAALWNMSGFEYYGINRIDFRQKKSMLDSQYTQFWWEGSPSLGSKNRIFTSLLTDHYCWDTVGNIGQTFEYGYYGHGDVVISTAPSPLTPPNLQVLSDGFTGAAAQRAAYYLTPYVLVPFGCDFTGQDLSMVYLQLDKIKAYVNAHPERYNNMRIRYVTLSEYNALVQDYATKHAIQFPVYREDFFPYADNAASYWTGYFSSRENLKQASRSAESVLKSVENVAAVSYFSKRLASPLNEIMTNVSFLRRAHALIQHHDGVAGTSKYQVALDYLAHLAYGYSTAVPAVDRALRELLSLDRLSTKLVNTFVSSLSDFDFASIASKGGLIPMIFANPVGRTVQSPTEVDLPETMDSIVGFQVIDASLQIIPSQITVYADGRRTISFISNIPAAGVQTLFLQPLNSRNAKLSPAVAAQSFSGGQVSLNNEYLKVDLDERTGEPSSMSNLKSGIQHAVRTELRFYESSEDQKQPSGAYIFRPAKTSADLVCSNFAPRVSFYHGSVFDMVLVNYTECAGMNATYSFRLWKGLPYADGARVETVNFVGPLNISASGREAVIRFVSDIASSGQFFTDDNGFDIHARTRNLTGRPGDADIGVALAGNFYPVVTRIAIADKATSHWLAAVSSSSHAGSSLSDGAFELMIARRLRVDDYRGVAEALNDVNVLEHPLWLLLEADAPSAARQLHHTAEVMNYRPQLWFAPTTKPITSVGDWQRFFSTVMQPVADLPANIHLLTFKVRSAAKAQLVLRFFHQFAVGEDSQLSAPVTIDIAKFLAPLNIRIAKVEETSLLLNHVLATGSTQFTIAPKEIKSFVVTVA